MAGAEVRSQRTEVGTQGNESVRIRGKSCGLGGRTLLRVADPRSGGWYPGAPGFGLVRRILQGYVEAALRSTDRADLTCLTVCIILLPVDGGASRAHGVL